MSASMKNTIAPEIIAVGPEADQVCCDGGNEALGHPTVWYTFDGQDRVKCMYCDRLFIKQGGAH